MFEYQKEVGKKLRYLGYTYFMDEMANGFGTAALIAFVILIIFILVVVAILKGINVVKVKTGKEVRFKSNLVTVGLAYIMLATICLFIKDYGKSLSFTVLPILSIFVLITLEILGLFTGKANTKPKK
jgi:hypothetical protein